MVELFAMEYKIEIMKNKSRLEGTGNWTEDDLTEREKEVEEWLESQVREERKKGLESRLDYMKIIVEGA